MRVARCRGEVVLQEEEERGNPPYTSLELKVIWLKKWTAKISVRFLLLHY